MNIAAFITILAWCIGIPALYWCFSFYLASRKLTGGKEQKPGMLATAYIITSVLFFISALCASWIISGWM